MARLSERDYQGALAVLREAGSVDGPVPFPGPVLDLLRHLVPCDVVTYHERLGGEPAVASSGEPRAPMTDEIRAACRRHWHEDRLTPWMGARKVSDLIPSRSFHRTELYQQVSGPVGIEDMMRLWLEPDGGSGARLEFDRHRADFTERDRSVLNVLLPHLAHFRRRAVLRRRQTIPSGTTTDKLTTRELDVLELVAEGQVNADIARLLWISPHTVRKHLENAFDKLGVHTRTAAVAAVRGSSRSDATRRRSAPGTGGWRG